LSAKLLNYFDNIPDKKYKIYVPAGSISDDISVGF